MFRGKFDSPERLQKCLETWKAEKSAVGADVEAEGLLATSSAKWMISVGHGAAMDGFPVSEPVTEEYINGARWFSPVCWMIKLFICCE